MNLTQAHEYGTARLPGRGSSEEESFDAWL